MPNTLSGINLAKIANKSLDFMARQFLPLQAFHRDFSEEIKDQGESITTRVASAVTAVDVSGGYTAQNVVTTPITVTLNQNPGFPWAFTDAEIYKAANNFDWLMKIFVEPATESVVKAILDYSFAIFTAANFASSVTKTAGQFDADVVADNAVTLTTNKAPKTERATIVLPTYYGNVAKDATVEDLSKSGSAEALRDMKVSRLRGFSMFEYTDIPTNGENLAGVSLHPSALAMAARSQITPPEFSGRVENITEPVSGLPLQWRIWYDANNKKTMLSVEALFGASKGNGAAAVRIKSA